MTITLPFPPSVNALFGNRSNQQRFMSKAYKEWLKSCPTITPGNGCIQEPCHVEYVLYFPDKRKRDLSNYIKAPEDYLVSQCALLDDNHEIVQSFSVKFGGIDRGNPRVEVRIAPII